MRPMPQASNHEVVSIKTFIELAMKSAPVQQERMSITFTKNDAWMKDKVERIVEMNPYFTKSGYIKSALLEHFRNQSNGTTRTLTRN